MSFADPRAACMARQPARRHGRKILIASVLALALAVEQLLFFLGSGDSSPMPPASKALAHPSTLLGQVSALVAQTLGPSDRGVRRFWVTSIARAPGQPGLSAVSLTWAVNGDLSIGSVSAGAQLELYLVLRTLYSAHLPIGAVTMTGTFGQRTAAGQSVEVPVLRVGLDRSIARLINWDAVDATTLWPLLRRPMVRPGFECQCQG